MNSLLTTPSASNPSIPQGPGRGYPLEKTHSRWALTAQTARPPRPGRCAGQFQPAAPAGSGPPPAPCAAAGCSAGLSAQCQSACGPCLPLAPPAWPSAVPAAAGAAAQRPPQWWSAGFWWKTVETVIRGQSGRVDGVIPG